jgi:LuxR family transcriptional regulator, maltose regulon positive regulatory protein
MGKGAVMARSTPRVEGGALLGLEGQAGAIVVGTPAWYAWLEQATTFAFSAEQGSFTARKERSGRSGWYWKAYRKHQGTLHRAYLGKSADLTLDRLTAIASELAGRATGPLSHDSANVLGPAPAAIDDQPPALTSARLPGGTLTFCFTDIEGSTQLWAQHPQAMPQALARHDAILRQAITAHRGVIFKTVGDGVYAVFISAPDALAAALAVQHALQTEEWEATDPLRVRLALHTGVAEAREGDYFGPTLNRVARLLVLGHGGQILLSQATATLVGDALPAGVTLRDLGTHPLKDLPHPEPIFQLVAADLPSEFPPLRTLNGHPAATPSLPPHLLATKLYAPPARPDLVARPRLFDRLSAGLSGKLTLIAAPAGFGKTTLVSAWIAETAEGKRQQAKDHAERGEAGLPFSVAWVSLDALDNDPTRFFCYVSAALNTLAPGSGDAALALLQAPQPPPIEAIVTTLVNGLSAALPREQAEFPAVLVLDDYHAIEAPAIHRALATLLEHLPVQLHLLLATRADPPLPLARLRACRQLSELRAADLRFSVEEATNFLTEVMGLPLSEADITALEARTEGWIAGLQLAALAMRDRTDLTGFIGSFTGSNRFVMQYLAEEVFGRQPSHIQTFLLHTAILERMCGPLCDAILGLIPDERPRTSDQGRPQARASVANIDQQPAPLVAGPSTDSYSQLILDQLERANLFLIPLDDERTWYRYHHLLSDVLRARLRSGTTPATLAGLHRRASAWYEGAGLIDEAIRHALAVPDVEAAAALVEGYATPLWLQRGDVLPARSWVEQLPDALIAARPRLTLAAGWTLALTGQLDAVEQLLTNAATTLSAPNLPAEVIGELTVLRSTIVREQGDLTETLALARRALDLLPAGEQTWRAGAAFMSGWAYARRGETAAAIEALREASTLAAADGSHWIALEGLEELAALQARQGQLTQCLRTCERAVELVRGRGQRPNLGAGMAYVGIGEVLCERNDLDGATHALMHGIELLRQTIERLLLVRGYAALARVQQARGDGASALATIQQGEEWFAQMQIPGSFHLTWLAAQRARLWLRQGNLNAAEQWIPGRALAGNRYLETVQQLTLVRLHLAQHQRDPNRRWIEEAAERLAQLRAAAEASGWMGDLIEILVLQALTLQALGDGAGALATLSHALRLAEREGYIRIFVDEGVPMLRLLQAGRAQGIAPNYISRLLAAFPASEPETRSPGDTETETLDHPVTPALVEPLSDRELEILRLIAAGRSNQEIADTLIIAVSTVKKHINNIYGKLDVQSRTQALVRSRELHLF